MLRAYGWLCLEGQEVVVRTTCRWMRMSTVIDDVDWVKEFVVSHTLDCEILWGTPASRQRKA